MLIRVSQIFALVLAVCLGAICQQSSDATSPAASMIGSAKIPVLSIVSSTVNAAAYFKPELVGTYRPDGRFKKASKRDAERGNSGATHAKQFRPLEVPPFVDLHRNEGVVEDYLPPAHARKAAKGVSLFASLRDDIITFAYGREKVLRAPIHVTTDLKQRLIISDPNEPAVHVLDGKSTFRIAVGPRYRLQQPNGIAVDGEGNIYVADGKQGTVLVYNSEGRFIRDVGRFRGENMFQSPTGIAIDRKAGHLYVLDSPADQLFVLDLAGNVLQKVGSHRHKTSGVNFNYPTGIALSNNQIVVLDSVGSRIQILDLQCNLLSSFKIGNVSGPPTSTDGGVALDKAANIYVSSRDSSSIRIYRQDGQFIGSFGPPGIRGIWIDATDRIYAADAANSRIQVFRCPQTPPNRIPPAIISKK